MWVRTTVTIERWTEEKPGHEDKRKSCDINRLPGWERRHLPEAAPSTDASTFSEGEHKEPERCCWKHTQCAGHVIQPFTDCGHHKLYLHTVTHCDCDSRRKSYRPISVAVIHHPIHHECRTDDLNEDADEEEEEEEAAERGGGEEEESQAFIPTQVGPTVLPTDPGLGTVPGAPDSAAPITIWRSESPTEKSPCSKVIKKIKKKKENEKDKGEEMSDEKAKPKKKAKKGKLTKKKSPLKSESSPADLSQSLSPRELVRTSESSPDSQADLDSEDSYRNRKQEEPSSEDFMESSSPRKREKSTTQAKKNGTKTSHTRKVTKRKSPPVSSPNLS
ncbi:protein PROCA1 isoform X3 [Cavia porcellus]|uniref:Protein interacting with cyclin A1 n=1 Tax=Cavia porcellus TaxID=10141 RepID=A0A286XB16_CAVPO|nr:protein PROCA1 isoform X3 [Cavia porcellus]